MPVRDPLSLPAAMALFVLGPLLGFLAESERDAFEASPGGRVRCSWEAENGVVGLQVEDDGPGVNAEARRRIFEPFYTRKKYGENPGLGLAVARAIVEEHGGRIEMGESDLGGASFTLYFEAPSDPTSTGS